MRHLRGLLAAAALPLLLLGGCLDATAEPPEGAIRVGEDHYMVPIGKDDAGCEQYSAWSAKRAVPAAVYYRKADGEFTLYRDDTGCGEN